MQHPVKALPKDGLGAVDTLAMYASLKLSWIRWSVNSKAAWALYSRLDVVHTYLKIYLRAGLGKKTLREYVCPNFTRACCSNIGNLNHQVHVLQLK